MEELYAVWRAALMKDIWMAPEAKNSLIAVARAWIKELSQASGAIANGRRNN